MSFISLFDIFSKRDITPDFFYTSGFDTCSYEGTNLKALNVSSRGSLCAGVPDTNPPAVFACIAPDAVCWNYAVKCTGTGTGNSKAGSGQIDCGGYCCNTQYSQCTKTPNQINVCWGLWQNPNKGISPQAAQSIAVSIRSVSSASVASVALASRLNALSGSSASQTSNLPDSHTGSSFSSATDIPNPNSNSNSNSVSNSISNSDSDLIPNTESNINTSSNQITTIINIPITSGTSTGLTQSTIVSNIPAPSSQNTNSSGGSKPSGGAIAGIVIGAVIAVIILMAVVIYCIRKHEEKKRAERNFESHDVHEADSNVIAFYRKPSSQTQTDHSFNSTPVTSQSYLSATPPHELWNPSLPGYISELPGQSSRVLGENGQILPVQNYPLDSSQNHPSDYSRKTRGSLYKGMDDKHLAIDVKDPNVF